MVILEIYYIDPSEIVSFTCVYMTANSFPSASCILIGLWNWPVVRTESIQGFIYMMIWLMKDSHQGRLKSDAGCLVEEPGSADSIISSVICFWLWWLFRVCSSIVWHGHFDATSNSALQFSQLISRWFNN